MYLLLSSLIFALPVFGLAEPQYGGGGSSSAAATTMAKASSTAAASNSIHSVVVGGGDKLTFSPETITAKVGDQIEFSFESSGHSVAEGDFNNACQPMGSSAFYSGFVKPGVGSGVFIADSRALI